MTDTTTARTEQLRAAFLAFVMVASVFGATVAFSGSAAAADSPHNGDVTPDNLDEGETNSNVLYNVTVQNVSTDGNTDTIQFTFADELATKGGFSVNGVQETNVSGGIEGSPSVVDGPDGDSVDDTVEFDVSPDNGGSNESAYFVVDMSIQAPTVNGKTGFDTGLNISDSDNPDLSKKPGTSPTLTLTVNDIVSDGITNSTDNALDEAAEINVSVSAAQDVDEDTINVSVTNGNTSETTDLVVNGSVTGAASSVSPSSFTDGTNSQNESVNLTADLQEGEYNLTVDADDVDGDAVGSTTFTSAFTVDMAGDSLRAIPDDSKPLAGDQATINVTAVDKNGDDLIFNDSNVNATGADLALQFPDSNEAANVTNETAPGDNTVPVNNTSTNGFDVQFGVNYSEVGDLGIVAVDSGGNLSKSSEIQQTYTATLDDVSVTADDGALVADGSDNETVTLQLVDQNDDPVPRSGESVSWGVISGNQGDAGLQVVSKETTTDSNGEATIVYNATTEGETIEVQGKSATFTDTATFDTVAGDVSASNSDFLINGSSQPNDVSGVEVDTQHTLLVDLQDAQNNPVENAQADLSANVSGVSFGSDTLTANSSGQAETTVTLPEQKGGVAINVSAGAFNASATGNAQINVTTDAASPTALQFGSDTRTFAVDSQDNAVDVEVADEFGNVNVSTTPQITIESSDTGVIDFDGSATVTTTLGSTSGTATFNADAASSDGKATLSVTTPDANVSNVSDTFSVGEPQSIEVTFDNDVSTSGDSKTRSTTTLKAQLIGPNGGALGVGGENVSFARQSGDAAELDQSESDFTNQTNSEGFATIQVNATSNTGQTTFFANSENYSASGSNTITTTGAADAIQLTPESSTIAPDETTNVTAAFVDTSDRTVPRIGKISLSTNAGAIDGATSKKTAFGDDRKATTQFVFNASGTSAGEADLTATGGGQYGETTISITQSSTGGISIDTGTIDPSAVDENTTVTHTLNFTVQNASNDGDSDSYEITFPSTVEVSSPTVTVTDASDSQIQVSSGPSLADANGGTNNQITFGIQPDANFDTATLDIDTGFDVTFPEVDSDTTADINASVTDSNAGSDTTTVAQVTISQATQGPTQPVGNNNNAPKDGDGDGLYEDVNGDNGSGILDVIALLEAYENDAVVNNNKAAFNFNGDSNDEVNILDVIALLEQV